MRLTAFTAVFLVLMLPERQAPAQKGGVGRSTLPSFSLSIDTDEQRVQRKGYVTAFQSDAVQTAIRQGFIDHIAVTYVAWVGTHSQSLVVSWTAIGTTAEVEKLRRSGRADTPVP